MATPPLRLGLPPALGPRRLRALAQKLEQLFAATGESVHVRVAGSYEHLEALLSGGGLDAAWANPLVLSRLEAAGARSFLQGVRGGRNTFRAALLVRRDSPYTLHTLTGARAAWTDPDALGGYLLPIGFLRAHGLDPARVFASERFTGSYPAALERLLDGTVDVAPWYATGDDEALLGRALEEELGPLARTLRPIAFTAETPNDGLVIAPHLPVPRASALAAHLLDQLSSDAGAAVRKLLDVDAVVAADGAIYAPVRALAA